MRLFTRAIRPPPDDITPNQNDPALVPPSTVGPDQLVEPGDPHGFELTPAEPTAAWWPPPILPSPWSGWPAEWWTPNWNRVTQLADLAWACVDLNARALAMMPPYLVDAAPTIDSGWRSNPDPEIYFSWQNFCKQLFWDWFAVGEVFVVASARYSTGWPARFRILPSWLVEVDMDAGRRRYRIGSEEISSGPGGDLLHLRYQDSTDDARGHGPLEAGRATLVAAEILGRYATTIAAKGLLPSSILEAPQEMSPDQAELLRDQWVQQRAANPGYPAVLSGGLKWTPTQLNPRDMALLELAQFTETRIAVLLGVPPPLVGLPSAGDSLTYSTALMARDQHWRMGLLPAASAVMGGLSGWLLPRGTTVELNSDKYVQPQPLERAQTAEIYNRIQDADGNPVLSVDEIREAERLDDRTTDIAAAPVLP